MVNKVIKDFENFDHFSLKYRKIHDKNLKISGANSDYFCEYKIKELVRHEKVKNKLRILDFGCGDGSSEVFFRKYFVNSQIVGIDVSKISISIARKKKIKDSNFSVFDGRKIPFEDGSFDIVFVACVVHHINNKHHQGIINELLRMVKPKGRLYIFEHNPLNPLTRLIVKDCIFDKNAVLLLPNEIKKLFKKDCNIEVINTIFFPRFGVFRFLIPLEKYLEKVFFGGQYYLRIIK